MVNYKAWGNISYLDRHVPLRDASHAQVRRYSVDIPMRYAECRAELIGGGTARLADKRQFVGRSVESSEGALLFMCDGELILLRTASCLPAASRQPWKRGRFIDVDGNLFEIGCWQMRELNLVPESRQSTFHLQPNLA